MTDLLVQFAVSNLLTSAALAAVAYAVHWHGRYPILAHLLWVLVLAKLVTPPLLALPLARMPDLAGFAGDASARVGLTAGGGGLESGLAPLAGPALTALLVIWGLGSLAVLGISLARIYRFDRLLQHTSRPAPGWVRFMADDAAQRLGMASAPSVYVSSARLSPMTWWTGGRVRIVLPEGLIEDIESQQLAWVLAHELAHVKRRDHMVRWLEWLAVVTFWWNPVAWWARRNLRLDEEASCDALVLEHLGAGPRSYARALLAVVEHLARPALQPPPVATGIDGGGSLERRFRLLISKREVRRAPRTLMVGLVGVSLLAMPMSIGQAGGGSVSPRLDTSASPDSGISDAERASLRLDDGPRVAPVAPQAQPVTEVAPRSATVSAKVKVSEAKKPGSKASKAKRAKKAAARKAARKARREQVVEIASSESGATHEVVSLRTVVRS